MASVQYRRWPSGSERWYVRWRENGHEQSRPFYRQQDAEGFRNLVNTFGGLPPPHIWDDNHRVLADQAPSGKPTFRSYAEQALHDRTRASEGTKRSYATILEHHVHPVIGDVPIDELTRRDLAKLVRELGNKSLSGKTKANIHGLVSSILKDAVTDGHLERNPAVGVLKDLPRVRSEDMVFLNDTEVQMILKHIPQHYQPMVRFAYGTGMRWGEITALQVRDVELFGRPVVHVRRAWKNHDATAPGEPKSRRARRTISLASELQDLLIPLVSVAGPEDYVFTNTYGRHLNHGDWYRRVWQKAVAAAQQDGLTKRPRFHDLRHSHVAWLISEGIKGGLPAIQRRLGHESIQTTIDRYGHLLPDLDDEINAAVDRALAPH